MAKLKENTIKIIEYVKSMKGQNITNNDIAEALGIPSRSVVGTITSMCKKGIMERVPAEIENDNGTHTPVKFIVMTDEGMDFDPYAEETPKAE